MGKTLDTGPNRLLRVEGAAESDTAQIASGLSPEGDVVVMLRMGEFVVAMTPDAADDIGRALTAEANIARMGEGIQ